MKTLTAMNPYYLLGVDSGGTFTDFVLFSSNEEQLRLHKVLSTPQAPEQAILKGLSDLGLDNKKDRLKIVHGTTVATNAALQSKGVKTAFITNRGFADMLSIGRQARPELYNLQPELNEPPVPKGLCIEVAGRCDANGVEIEPLSETDLDELEHRIRSIHPEAIAINLLFSFQNDTNERRIEDRLKSLAYVCRSSSVLPEIREYERGIATWYNAYLGPLVANYLRQLESSVSPAPVSIMQSSGGTIALNQAADKAVNLLLSGPAGGLAAGAFVGQLKDNREMLSFDMGGTSTDVALIEGEPQLTSEGHIGRYPIAVPMVDMHTIGAGGGSIAYIDDAEMLHVGPESAGADPGPACYGKGGLRPTVTDANTVLGRLQPDNFLGGGMTLDTESAHRAISALADPLGLSIEEAAIGIIDLANEHMTQALRVISEQRGHNPAEYLLVGFGGAGGLHICALAENIGINSAMVPIHGGVFSAFGMLVAPKSRNLSRSYLKLVTETDRLDAERKFDQMRKQALEELLAEDIEESEIQIKRSVDCRYQGQSFTLEINWDEASEIGSAFHQSHKSSYGHSFDLDVELVNLRLSAQANAIPLKLNQIVQGLPSEKNSPAVYAGRDVKDIWIKNSNGSPEIAEVRTFNREDMPVERWMPGPALIYEASATIWIEPEWQVKRDDYGNLSLEKHI